MKSILPSLFNMIKFLLNLFLLPWALHIGEILQWSSRWNHLNPLRRFGILQKWIDAWLMDSWLLSAVELYCSALVYFLVELLLLDLENVIIEDLFSMSNRLFCIWHPSFYVFEPFICTLLVAFELTHDPCELLNLWAWNLILHHMCLLLLYCFQYLLIFCLWLYLIIFVFLLFASLIL